MKPLYGMFVARMRAAHWLCAGLCVLCAGCASDVKVAGNWRPVNVLDAAPRAIEQAPEVQFIATPIDRSLRSLLTRWAREGNLALEFKIDTDYSLSAKAASIRAGSIHAALEALNQAYADSGVQIGLSSGVITASARVLPEIVSTRPAKKNSKRKAKR